ncbi:MAG TPA: hypothetical protein VNQ56_12945 [Pseudolabrys sp.]|nr:hypothetical protein [Pseudolabrys sp.]
MIDDRVREIAPSNDLIAFAIQDSLGERCASFDPDCYTCRAWQQYDRAVASLFALRQSAEIEARSVMLRQPNSGECELVVCSSAGVQVYRLTSDQVRLLAVRSVSAAFNLTACATPSEEKVSSTPSVDSVRG